MTRAPFPPFLSKYALVAALVLAPFAGCGAPPEDPVTARRAAALAACHLNDGTVGHDADIRACDAQDVKKTTICHVPPGNPANAHTLCVGNPAVAPHMHHHGDSLGPCKVETPCPPPATGAGGSSGPGDGPAGTGGGPTGAGGSSGPGGTGGGAGSGDSSGPIVP